MLTNEEISVSIESSCDDTSICIFKGINLMEMKTISSIQLQQLYGGVVPEIASREHLKNIHVIFDELITKHQIDPLSISNIFCTNEPGLPGSLHIGILFARTLAFLTKAKLYFINHLHAHIFSAFINDYESIKFPFQCLVASGGNTILYLVNSFKDIQILNETVDDAVGEVYDKVARALGWTYPGGPCIDNNYDPQKADMVFLRNKPTSSAPFSFSGIKTAVLNHINQLKMKSLEIDEKKISSSFQKNIIELLIDKIKYYSKLHETNSIVLGGGVSANSLLRQMVSELDNNFKYPELKYTGDNAAMIGFLGILLKKEGVL